MERAGKFIMDSYLVILSQSRSRPAATHGSQKNPYAGVVMLYDLLYGKGIEGGGGVKRLLVENKVRLL